jgi:hypothetical protein
LIWAGIPNRNNKIMKPVSSKLFWQTFIWSSILLSSLAIFQTSQQVMTLGIILWRSKWVVLLGLFVLNIGAGAFGLRQLSMESGARWIEKLEFSSKNMPVKLFGFILVLFGFSLVWVVRLIIFGNTLPQVTPIFWVFLWASLLQALGLKLISGYKWHILFALIILVQGLTYQIYGHLIVITDYPFSIGYSEASRYYYASMFFAERLYEIKMPLPFLHPTRYFLMSLPFLIEGLPLWVHRMWQALLWIGLTAASSILLIRRLRLSGWMQFFVASWAFLFFLQGAVYYHLQVCVILIFAGVSARHPWRSFIVILIASLWAGVSRVNWFPVPAMLAISIYLMEMPIENKGWRYWLTPFVWGITGIGFAILSQFIYINISGNADIRAFGSSFTSDLLWNRLLPNDISPLGIFLGVLIVSAPLFFAIAQILRRKFYHLHPLRWLALSSLLIVLFLGGLAVSTKIGGGGDLHNMDAFLVMLALIASSFFAGRIVGDDHPNPAWGQISWPVIAAVMLVPLGFALRQIGSFQNYDHASVKKDIQKLQQVTSKAAAGNSGEVLFITERQLLTFKILTNIPLISEYEQLELMEMAMSGNREYLEQYYSDLNNHRFAVIIAEKQKKYTTQKKIPFIEENNAWVRYVGAPLLCAYEPIESLSSTNVQIFVPRPSQPACKDPFSE